MNPHATPARRLTSELTIGLSVCAGLYMLLVDPVDGELAELRATAASTGVAAGPAGTSDPIAARRTLAEVGAYARQFLARSDASQNEAALFGTMMQEAERAGVRLDSVQPGTARPRQLKPRPAPDVAPGSTPPPPPPEDKVRACTLHVTGTYDALCRFIAAVQAAEGFTVVRAGSVQPVYTPGSREVQATIHTEHVAMDGQTLAAFARAGAMETPR